MHRRRPKVPPKLYCKLTYPTVTCSRYVAPAPVTDNADTLTLVSIYCACVLGVPDMYHTIPYIPDMYHTIQQAETQVVQLQAANERLQQEVLLLQQHIKELEVKVAGMQDVEEVTHAAMHKLEDTLARIEKVAVVTGSAPGIRLKSSVPQGPRGAAVG
jgi:peptidoglycan hydrolase CwlO-like protein